MFLLICNGSWRAWDVETLPPGWARKHAMPDSPLKTLRFHRGKFEVLVGPEEKWVDTASVEVNGGVDQWLENTVAFQERCLKNESEILEFAVAHGWRPE